MSKLGRLAQHFSHDWVVGIVGGVIAVIIGAYLLAAIGVGAGSSPSALPPQSAAEQLTVEVNPASVDAGDRTTIGMTIAGAAPNSTVSIDGFTPSGSTLFATTLRTDDEGKTRTTLPWPPEGDPAPTPGPWKITAYNTETGSSAVAYLLVMGDDRGA